MTIAIPTTEPTELRAGDTWEWARKDLADFPAPTWTLKYQFKNASAFFSIIAAADGVNHAVTVAKGITATYASGLYQWSAFTDNGTLRYTIGTGNLNVLRNFDDSAIYDHRSHARKTLENIEAVLENRATMEQLNYSIEGRSLERRSLAELLKLRDSYRAEVAAQDAAIGLGASGNIFIRFGSA